MKNIFIIRHGQTDYNLNGVVQGRGIDSILNATGHSQAGAFYKTYSNIEFEIVYTSSLRRTHQTVQPFLADGLPHKILPALDEIDWGIFEGIAHDPQMHQRYESIINKWRNDELSIKIDGGESAADLQARLLSFVKMLRSSSETNILVCTHGRSMRALLCELTGKPLRLMDDFPHANTSLYKLRYLNGEFEIELFNNSDHLNEGL